MSGILVGILIGAVIGFLVARSRYDKKRQQSAHATYPEDIMPLIPTITMIVDQRIDSKLAMLQRPAYSEREHAVRALQDQLRSLTDDTYRSNSG